MILGCYCRVLLVTVSSLMVSAGPTGDRGWFGHAGAGAGRAGVDGAAVGLTFVLGVGGVLGRGRAGVPGSGRLPGLYPAADRAGARLTGRSWRRRRARAAEPPGAGAWPWRGCWTRGWVSFRSPGGAAELAVLEDWCGDGQAGAVRLVCGGGGAGKTRGWRWLWPAWMTARGWRCTWVAEGRGAGRGGAAAGGRVGRGCCWWWIMRRRVPGLDVLPDGGRAR